MVIFLMPAQMVLRPALAVVADKRRRGVGGGFVNFLEAMPGGVKQGKKSPALQSTGRVKVLAAPNFGERGSHLPPGIWGGDAAPPYHKS